MRSQTIGATILVFVAMLAATGSTFARAQEASPAPDPLAGVTIEALGSNTPDVAADHALVLLRLTLAPGTVIAEHSHPGAVVLAVESGTRGTTFTQGDALITRAAVDGTATPPEEVTMDAEALLEVGDSIAYGQDAAHIMRNAGDDPLVLLVSALLAADRPGFIFAQATPTP